jgi:type III restriction enzyme
LELKKTVDLVVEMLKVKEAHPTTFSEFERDFPSICFSLATGVGKTRLMGAFIAYLNIAKGIKNFLVLAPNLTIYNKLIEDFSNPSHPKYVFQGISEFVHHRPIVITGDTYQNYNSQYVLFEDSIQINVFNISKLNAETRGGAVPRIKRLMECLGEAYFNYLAGLPDLVLLMDESHHYRADRGMQVINELKPILGLELTATPQIERAGGAIKFKNVVYEYSLAKAIKDGFVKEPAVATRKDFDPSLYTVEDLDRIKLEDGVRIHEDTRVALDIYSRNNNVPLVKPFMLVVAQNTEHSGKLKDLIASNAFFEGRYAGKVMEINSSQSGSEKEDNIERLLNLESADNQIEIVVHVNMLKEGWDVTNLYTIVPLRTATSQTLREQTIGRGLRLPYGNRTGDPKADKLTIVAHDKFQAIIEAANREGSIIRRENIIEIAVEELSQTKEVVTVQPQAVQQLEEQKAIIEKLPESADKNRQLAKNKIQQEVLAVIPEMNRVQGVKSVQDLKKPEIKEIVIDRIREKYAYAQQGELYVENYVKEAEAAYDALVKTFTQNIIEIPRITIHPKENVRCGFKDFDLDARSLNYQPVSEEIYRQNLRDGQRDAISGIGAGIVPDKLDNLIVNELINFPEVDYDRDAKLLFKLANQAIDKFKANGLNKDDIENVVQNKKRELGSYIYAQLMDQFEYEPPTFEEIEVLPFEAIVQHNNEKIKSDAIEHYTVTIDPTSDIPKKLFMGFKKSCHDRYKFGSKTEKDFATILENDTAVLKWLKPAQKQFKIYWEHNSREYEPDFVVETKDCIYLVETKMRKDLGDVEVQSKARAALQYCQNATRFTKQNSGKPWKYVLIPHDAVLLNASFDALMTKYEYRE